MRRPADRIRATGNEPPAPPTIRRLGYRAMGTDFEVQWCQPATTVPGLRAQHLTRLYERRFTRFRLDSELSRLNRSAGRWVRVSPDMFAVLNLAVGAWRWTAGLFNPLVLPALSAAGYDRDFSLGLPVRRSRALPPPPAAAIEFRPRQRAVRLPGGSGLDLGGIVKGWTADRLIPLVRGNGLVNAGGDLRAVGPADTGFGWVVGVADPTAEGRDAFLVALQNEGVATSGVDRRRWQSIGGEAHHVIDPRTGRPAETDLLTVTVVAATAVQAEVAAKAALILGAERGLAFLETSRLAGVLLQPGGTWHATSRMQGRFL